jgi:hypothetical protein
MTSHVELNSGANPTIESYNASTINIYNATSCQLRFENKQKLFLMPRKTLLPITTLAL